MTLEDAAGLAAGWSDDTSQWIEGLERGPQSEVIAVSLVDVLLEPAVFLGVVFVPPEHLTRHKRLILRSDVGITHPAKRHPAMRYETRRWELMYGAGLPAYMPFEPLEDRELSRLSPLDWWAASPETFLTSLDRFVYVRLATGSWEGVAEKGLRLLLLSCLGRWALDKTRHGKVDQPMPGEIQRLLIAELRRYYPWIVGRSDRLSRYGEPSEIVLSNLNAYLMEEQESGGLAKRLLELIPWVAQR